MQHIWSQKRRYEVEVCGGLYFKDPFTNEFLAIVSKMHQLLKIGEFNTHPNLDFHFEIWYKDIRQTVTLETNSSECTIFGAAGENSQAKKLADIQNLQY